MSISYKRLICAALLTVTGGLAMADGRPYTDGNVTTVTFIRTKPGMFDAYMAWLGGERKKEVEAQKKAGIIVSYAVYTAQPHNAQDADIILTVTFKNWAAFDGLADKEEAIDKQIWGSTEGANKAAISREEMRTVLGSDTMQEAVFK